MESAFVDDFIVYWPPILQFSPVFCPVNPRTVKSPADKDLAKTGPLEATAGADRPERGTGAGAAPR